MQMVRLSVRDILLILLGQKISTVGKAHRGDPHKDEVGVEKHDCFSHQGGYENYFCRLGGPELLNDFVEQTE